MRTNPPPQRVSRPAPDRRPGRCAASSGLGLLLALLGTCVGTAEPTAVITVRPSHVYVGESATVTVSVSGADRCEQPVLPEISDCELRPAGTSSQTTTITDARGQLVTRAVRQFHFMLTPLKAGRYTVGPATVMADGRRIRTETVELVARDVPTSPPERADDDTLPLRAVITCRQKKLFVGQRADFTLTISIKAARYGQRPVGMDLMLQCISGSFGPFNPRQVQTGRIPPPADQPDGEAWYFVELPASFVLDEPGPVDFSGVYVMADYPQRFSRDLFGDLRISRRKRLRIRPLVDVPEVQPLPADGRPANFSGAVGHFDINVIAVPTNVRVGDPIELTITITGDAVESLSPPDLTRIPGLTDDFRVAVTDLSGTVSGNQKHFKQTLRAKRADVKEIPPVEFVYFDPDQERYVTARSDPIPLLVTAVEQLDASDLGALSAAGPVGGPQALQTRDGLRGNKTDLNELLASSPAVGPGALLAVTAAGPLVFALALVLGTLLRSDAAHQLRRRRGALRAARQRIDAALRENLPAGQLGSHVEAALAHYLAGRLAVPAARLRGPALVETLAQRGVDGQVLERCRQLLEQCQQAAYAGGPSDHSLAEQAQRLLDELERIEL